MKPITGYGRGWNEPLAVGRWARFKQKMREPAVKTDYAIAFAVLWLVFLAAMLSPFFFLP